MFLSCRAFVVNTTISTGLVGDENVVLTMKGLQDKNIQLLDGTTVENKGNTDQQVAGSIPGTSTILNVD